MTDQSESRTPDSSGLAPVQPIVSLNEPVSLRERVSSIDTLRGFALLGILVMNIFFFALPGATLFNPNLAGGMEGINRAVWLVTYVVFNQKFMALFSMLFGAGVVLMSQRTEASGRKFGGVYYRRLLWLLLFGLAHAYFIWMGDILVWYALAGIWLYPLRKLAARGLLVIGAVVLLIGIPASFGLGVGMDYMRSTAEAAMEAKAAGRTLSEMEQSMLTSWEETRRGMMLDESGLEEDLEVHRGDYWGIVTHRAPDLLQSQLFGGFIFGWRIIGLMILGMGFMKLGLFSATRKKLTYLVLVIVVYCLAIPVSALGASQQLAHDFDLIYMFQQGMVYDYLASVLVALGHVGLVMLVCRSGVLTWLRERLAAVGRMAFTNYLLQSLICTTIFYGYGLGLYGHVERAALQLFTLGVWVIQLLWSKWWLERFHMGPFEWCWRSLTYWKRPAFRRTIAAE